ncbi:hypothetical protein [Mannheimia haemolytica]|uniref:hypothetical protein n=1 Tax=Mannheimia haemolytica TaxID=75985 RepID=UPI0039FCE603
MTQNIETGVEVVAVGKQFVAKFYYDGKLQHSTHPQYSRQNAIMLINRKIERFNVSRDKPIKLYKE